MGKVIPLDVSEETFLESEYDLKDEFFFEARSDTTIERAAGLTPIGYDNEIGLWEELESRYYRDVTLNEASTVTLPQSHSPAPQTIDVSTFR